MRNARRICSKAQTAFPKCNPPFSQALMMQRENSRSAQSKGHVSFCQCHKIKLQTESRPEGTTLLVLTNWPLHLRGLPFQGRRQSK